MKLDFWRFFKVVKRDFGRMKGEEEEEEEEEEDGMCDMSCFGAVSLDMSCSRTAEQAPYSAAL